MDTLIPNDQPAPNLALPDLDGHTHTLEDYQGRVTIINFWSAECPWAERADLELVSYLKSWGDSVILLSVASNANEPMELLKRVSTERGLPLVLHDSSQQVADLYGAITTPHLFVVDTRGILRYQGAINDATFLQRIPSRMYLRQAVQTILEGRRPDPAQTPPFGCTIVHHFI